VADSVFGNNPLVLDLVGVTGARVIVAAPQKVKIRAVHLVGAHAATNGNITIRQGSASGPVVWAYSNQDATGAAYTTATVNIFNDFAGCNAQVDGLYMDDVSVDWLGLSNLIIWYD
jgi:hypothetical protein